MSENVSKQQSSSPQSKVVPLKLPKNIFSIKKINSQAIFDSIMSERASRRQGTHSVKSRSVVSGSGRKPYSQKGTGNSRQGSKRSPQWVGGGVAFGPTPNRNYLLKINKKVKQLAFKSALTLKAKAKAILVNDFKFDKKPNTKSFLKQFEALKINKKFKKILIIANDPILAKSVSNLQKVHIKSLVSLLIEEIINADFIIFSKESMKLLESRE